METIVKKASKMNDSWYLFLFASILLLLYTISRIISLSRRVKDLEARPPVDEIILRGLIRQEVHNHTEKLDGLIQEKIGNIELDLEVVKKKKVPKKRSKSSGTKNDDELDQGFPVDSEVKTLENNDIAPKSH